MFLTSVATNLLALGAGRPVLPALSKRLPTGIRIAVAPAGASPVPRFDHARHLASLAADPPAWPDSTNAASLLALDLVVPRQGFGTALPPQRIRLELLDYPGEWLLDLPLLRTTFQAWSEQTLLRLQGRAEAAEFLAFQSALPHRADRDEALADTGHRLYRMALTRLSEGGLALLQPGRFLMPPPGPAPGWFPFFPHRGSGGLQTLLEDRYGEYVKQVRRDLSDPLFGKLDRLVVLVDLLSALHRGAEAFHDAQAALAEAAGALRWGRSVMETAMALSRLQSPPRIVTRVVFAATKADHVGKQQRDNLAALLRRVAGPAAPVRAAYFAMASVLCTTDDVMLLDKRPVSAVRGHQVGERVAIKSYPGEVPSSPPDDAFWSQPFYALPNFQPLRPAEGGRAGVPNLALDSVLLALLDDVL